MPRSLMCVDPMPMSMPTIGMNRRSCCKVALCGGGGGVRDEATENNGQEMQR